MAADGLRPAAGSAFAVRDDARARTAWVGACSCQCCVGLLYCAATRYAALVAALPAVYVGAEERLPLVVEVRAAAAVPVSCPIAAFDLHV